MIKDTIKVSLVVPVYGAEQYIAEFADSAFSQTYGNVEYIFVNDGTKDRSIEVLESVLDERYSHLKDNVKIVHKENGGLPAARKTGLEHATGDYVWHVDPDDWIELDSIDSIVKVINETGADVVYFNLFKEYADRSKLKRDKYHAADAQKEYVWDMFNHNSFGSLCNKCIRRSLYQNPMVIFARYSYAEDTFLSSQLVGYSECIAYLDKPLYHYRKTNPNAITRQNLIKRHREYALNFMRLYDHYRSLDSAASPISAINDDILIKLGWYSILYGADLKTDYPYFVSDLRKASVNFKSDVFFLAQIFTKIFYLFVRR